MVETNTERLRLLDEEKEFNMCGITGKLLSIELSNKDYSFLFTEAERAQELVKAYELKDMEHIGLVQQLKEKDSEINRLRETLKRIEEIDMEGYYVTGIDAIARQALEGKRDG